MNLINQRVLKKALQVILKGLFKQGKLSQFNHNLQFLKAGGQTTTQEFPGFDLFTQDRDGAPYRWFFTKPRIGVVEYLLIYEEFVNRNLGTIRNPGKVAAQIFDEHSESVQLFKGNRDASLWLSPAILMAVVAQFLGAEREAQGRGSICLRVGGSIVEVTPKGCWSNTMRRLLPSATEGIVGECPTVPFPDTATSNPILTSFSGFSETLPYNMQYAACILALGLQDGTITDAWLEDQTARKSVALMRKSSLSPEALDQAVNALQRADSVLDSGANSREMIEQLYQIVVPSLMGAGAFANKFGDFRNVNPERKSAPETIQRWRSIFEDTLGKLKNANC